MEERKWEDVNSDCLVNIFGRLDLESRVLNVPLVCKQWLQALLSPLCWQRLVFPSHIFWSRLSDGTDVNSSELIKFVIGRSQGCATILVLPEGTPKQDLIFVSDECPALKILSLKYVDHDTIPELIVKWKSLEVLRITSCNCMVQIIDKLSFHCKNFIGLSVVDAQHIDHEVASAIVSKLPTIKALYLDKANLDKVNLMLILRGCKELETLYVRNCFGFDEDDEEILKLASGIKNFKCEGSYSMTNDTLDFIFSTDFINSFSSEEIDKIASDIASIDDGVSDDEYSVLERSAIL